MPHPAFMRILPQLDTPLPADKPTASAVRGDSRPVVFCTVHEDIELPEHVHKDLWGSLFADEIELTVTGKTRTCHPGDPWDLPAGTKHSAVLKAGALLIDVFEVPDRYPVRPAK